MQSSFDSQVNKIFRTIDTNFPNGEAEGKLVSGIKRKEAYEALNRIERLMTLLFAIKKHSNMEYTMEASLRDEDAIGFELNLSNVVTLEKYTIVTLFSAISNKELSTENVPFRQIFIRILRAKAALSFVNADTDVLNCLVDVIEGEIPVLPSASKEMMASHIRYEPIFGQETFTSIITDAGMQPNLNEKSVMTDMLVYMIGNRRFDNGFESLLNKANNSGFEGFDAVLLKMVNQLKERALGAAV